MGRKQDNLLQPLQRAQRQDPRKDTVTDNTIIIDDVDRHDRIPNNLATPAMNIAPNKDHNTHLRMQNANNSNNPDHPMKIIQQNAVAGQDAAHVVDHNADIILIGSATTQMHPTLRTSIICCQNPRIQRQPGTMPPKKITTAMIRIRTAMMIIVVMNND